GEMRDDLADLLLGDAVVEGAVEMAGQLPLAAERDQRRDDDQAAVALLQAGTLPDLAEQHLLAVIDQVGNDVADRVARRICLRLGHGFLRWGLGGLSEGRHRSMPCCSINPAQIADQTAVAASASSRSRIRSSALSNPIDRRTTSGPAPAASRCSSESCRCVVEAGCRIRLRVSPILARCENSPTFSTSLIPASEAALTPKVKTPPAAF